MEQLPAFIILPLLLLSIVLPIAGRWWPHTAFPMATLAVGSSAIASILTLVSVLGTGPIHYQYGGWPPPLGIEHVADHVSAFVSAVITSVALVVVIATRRLVTRIAADRLGNYYSLVLLFLTGITGIILTADLFNLFVFLEIASIAAYALIFMGGRAGMIAGFRYLILGTIGSSFYLLGVGFLYFSMGTLNMGEMQEFLAASGPSRSVEAAAVFILVGLGLKMALVPLHFWLPDAYNFAPSAVNSLLAPIMTKAAAYAILRMFISVFPEGYLVNEVPVGAILVILGLIGIVAGPIAAVAQRDLRRMLAYSSIGQLSLIAVGIGLATPLAMTAALLHVMNHTVMKAALFLTAASVRLSVRSSRIDDFVGLGPRMPLTFLAFSLAGIAMIGLPPTAGFFSKWYLAQAAVDMGLWPIVLVVLASTLLTAAYVFKVLEQAYLRPAQPDPHAHGVEEDEGYHMTHPSTTTGTVTASAVVAVEAEPETVQETPVQAKESPMDLVVPALLLSVIAVLLGIFNVFIVTNVLEPGVS